MNNYSEEFNWDTFLRDTNTLRKEDNTYKLSADNYKIGYFYNIICYSYWRCIIIATYNNHTFVYKNIDESMMPHNLHYTNMAYYTYDYPVLYKENDSGEITEVVLISDLLSEIANNDFEYIPVKTSGNKIIQDAKILKNGEEIVFDDFSNDVLNSFSIRASLNKMRYEAELPIIIEPYLEEVRKLKKYIDSINIKEILKSLKVTVSESFITKVGGDDRYKVYRTASISNEVASQDEYLRKIWGLGEECIHSDSGYTSAYNMRIKDLIVGEYKDSVLEEEKNRLMLKYSKEEHLGYLFSALMVERNWIRQYDLPTLESLYATEKDKFRNKWPIEFVENTNREVEKLFYPLSSRVDNVNAILENINSQIQARIDRLKSDKE